MAGIAQRVFVENFEEQLIIDTVSEELNLRIFLDDDEGTIVNVYGGDINVCPDELIVVKNFRLGGVTGSGVIDIGAFAREFMIDQIIFTRTAGVPTTAKAGWTAGTNEVMWSTDLSHLVALIPKSVSVKVVPPSTATEVHFTLAAGTFNIDLILIRYKI